MAGKYEGNWLVIMDNADDPSLNLAPFLPRCPHGHVIITTRDRHRGTLSPNSAYPVDKLPLEESIALLLNTSQYEDSAVNRELSKRIAQELGCLPLALAHAGSYIRLRQCLDTYLKTYRESSSQLLQRKFDMPQDYPYSVARTIHMSLEKLSSRSQELIGLFSHLDARSIPRSMIEKAASRRFLHVEKNTTQNLNSETIKYADALNSIICPRGLWSSLEFDNLIEECERYSLIQFSIQNGDRFYSMHVLVQMFLKKTFRVVYGHSSCRLVARLLGSTITTGDQYKYIAVNRLLPSHLRLVNLDDIIEAGDHYGFGFVLEEMGEERLAVSHMERCVDIWKEALGDDSKLTLDAMELLAASYRAAGNPEDALSLNEKIVEKRKRLLGEDHLDTLMTISQLSFSYSKLGRDEEALLLREKVVEKLRKLLGDDHLETLQAIHSLAKSYSKLGREQEALSLREEVAEKRRRLLGEDHLHTLAAVRNLATSLSQQGRTEEALPLAEEVVNKRAKLLGEHHPYTLHAMDTLANIYTASGQEDEALRLRAIMLSVRSKSSGERRSNTMSTAIVQ
jgi:tetratricopeptide (TPR) repeat protein